MATGAGKPAKPTLKDVAKLAGVSVATVSRVLSDTRSVAPDTRARVLQAIEQLRYRPNVLARSVRKGESRTLGFVVPDIANPFFSELAKGVEAEAHRLGYRVVLCDTGDDPQQEAAYVQMLAEHQVDGVLCVTAARGPYRALEYLSESGIPIVLLDRVMDGFIGDTVITDNVRGAYIATRHLIALGHERVAFAGGPPYLSTTAQRLQGYRRAMAEHGLPVREEWITAQSFTYRGGYDAFDQLFRQSFSPDSRRLTATAVLCGNDLMAAGLLRAAEDRGFRLPEDLAVVGFDDIFLAALWKPALSTVAQSRLEMGRLGVQTVLRRRSDGGGRSQCLLVPPELIVRDSCGSKKKG